MDLAVQFPGSSDLCVSGLEELVAQGVRALEITEELLAEGGCRANDFTTMLGAELRRLGIRVTSICCDSSLERMEEISQCADQLRRASNVAGTVFISLEPPRKDDCQGEDLTSWAERAVRIAEDNLVTACFRSSPGTLLPGPSELLGLVTALASHYAGVSLDVTRLSRAGEIDLKWAVSLLGPSLRVVHLEGRDEVVNLPLLKETLVNAPYCDAIIVEGERREDPGQSILTELLRLWPLGDTGQSAKDQVSLYPVDFMRSSKQKRKKRKA